MVKRLIEFFCRKGVGSLRFEGRACWITGDPIMLRRAISNLLSNTMRYTPPGKTITLRIKEADDQIHIIVETPVRQSRRNICRAFSIIFIALIPPASVKGKAAV